MTLPKSRSRLNIIILGLILSTLLPRSDAAVSEADSASPDTMLAGRYQDVISSKSNDQAILAFDRHLAALQKSAHILVQQLEAANSAALDAMVMDEHTKSDPIDDAILSIDRYGSGMDGDLTIPPADKDDERALHDYRDAIMLRAESRVFDLAAALTKLHPAEAPNLEQLYFVLPFLAISDDNWTVSNLTFLPPRLRATPLLTTGEQVALSAGRVRTACWFATQRAQMSSTERPHTLETYIPMQAERLYAAREYRAAASVLITGIESADAQNQPARSAAYRVTLADVYAKTGNAALAADEVLPLNSVGLTPDQYGHGLALRLEYLYRCARLDDVVQVNIAEGEHKYGAYLPSIIYQKWRTLRKLRRLSEASSLQKDFVSRFADNPYGADIMFASIVDLLEASKYEDALREMTFVEEHYPNAQVIPKVKELRQKLQVRSTSK